MPTKTLTAIAVTGTIWAATAGVAGATSALTTPYESAPGHTPSLSAECVDGGVEVGYHPWDHGARNFQIWDGDRLLVNTNEPDQTWTLQHVDRIRYAGTWYTIDATLCAEQLTPVTTFHTTPLPTIPAAVDEPLPLTTTTTESPSTTTTAPVVDIEPPAIQLISDPPQLPETGGNTWRLAITGASLVAAGAALTKTSRRPR